MGACHDSKRGLLQAKSFVCLVSGSKADTGNVGDMNCYGRQNNGRPKWDANSSSHSWYSYWQCPTEKAKNACKHPVGGGFARMYLGETQRRMVERVQREKAVY